MTQSIILRSLLGLALGTSLATGAWAQQSNQDQAAPAKQEKAAQSASEKSPGAKQQGQARQMDSNQSQQQAQGRQDRPEIVALGGWRYDELYNTGRSVERMLDNFDVRGVNGEEIGDVENVVFDPDNKVVSVIAEVGGFWDIGDTHVSVPWDQVEFSEDGETILVPVNRDNIDDYSVFGEDSLFTEDVAQNTRVVDEDLETGERLWKATEVLDDYALLGNYASYGYVNDLIMDEDGQIQAVLVTPRRGYGVGPYAYPFYGYRYGNRPGDPYYNLQYGEGEIADRERFDLSRMANRNEDDG